MGLNYKYNLPFILQLFSETRKHGFEPSNAKMLITVMHPYTCFDALITYTIRPNGTKFVAQNKTACSIPMVDPQPLASTNVAELVPPEIRHRNRHLRDIRFLKISCDSQIPAVTENDGANLKKLKFNKE